MKVVTNIIWVTLLIFHQNRHSRNSFSNVAVAILKIDQHFMPFEMNLRFSHNFSIIFSLFSQDIRMNPTSHIVVETVPVVVPAAPIESPLSLEEQALAIFNEKGETVNNKVTLRWSIFSKEILHGIFRANADTISRFTFTLLGMKILSRFYKTHFSKESKSEFVKLDTWKMFSTWFSPMCTKPEYYANQLDSVYTPEFIADVIGSP